MKTYRRLLAFLLPYRWRLAAALICSGLVSALNGAYAWLVKPAIDEVFISKSETWIVLIPLLLILVTALKGVASYGQAYLMTFVGVRVVTDIRDRLFAHLMRLPMGFHVKHPSSHMLSRVINDVNWIQSSVASVLKDVVQHSLTFLVLLGYAFYLNWSMTLIAIVALPATIYPIVRFGARMRALAAKGQERTADMSLALQETLTGIRIVKGFTQEDRETARFKQINEAYFRTWMKSTQVSSWTTPVLEIIGATGIAGIIWYGGMQVVRGTMTPGVFFSFFTAAFLMYNPLKRVAGANNTIQQALAAAERVFQVLDQPTEAATDTGTKPFHGVVRSVEFQDVSFNYEGVEAEALRNISLTVKAGESVALVGNSGAGKTTLVNLIPRFYEPSAGRILIDGVDTREIKLAELRAHIGIVSQDTLLFDATVKENIAYGTEGATDEAVRAAAEAAYAHEFIQRMPNGYETFIGENGVKLSGGERQRISIARAILKNPSLLILDEATSALDSESERKVQLALANLMKHRTTFVIAHRLSTVQNADQIVVMDRGSIAEIGTHEELVRRGGLYQRLHAMQFSSEELAR